jgi:competence ComEA-like helix-hairpin-helix protein
MKPERSDAPPSQNNTLIIEAAELGSSTGPHSAGAPCLSLGHTPWRRVSRAWEHGFRGLRAVVGPDSVWGPPLQKAVLGGLLLLFVAYLGHISHKLENYGPIRSLDQQVVRLVEAAHENDLPRQGKGLAPSMQQGPLAQAAPSAPTQAQDDNGSRNKPPECPKIEVDQVSAILRDGRVILNEASATELDTLPGIGATRAQAIIDLRARLGRFKKVDDLLRIRGIGWKALGKLKEHLVLDRPIVASEGKSDQGPSKAQQDEQVPVSQSGEVAPSAPPKLVAAMASFPSE